MRFENRVMVVTGAAQGIGKGIAVAAAAEGAKVVLVDRSDYVEQVVEEIKDRGGDAIGVIADLETYEGSQNMVKSALEAYQAIDILINNVGGAIWMKPFEAFSEEEIVREISRSLFPTIWACHSVLPGMLENGGGVIVNISSIATKGIYRIPYSAAKGGVNALTKSLAFEYGDRGIRINAIATGGTEAPERIIPRNNFELSDQDKQWMKSVVSQTISATHFKRYGTIDEQVRVALFLASDESSYMTGSVIPVGGGDQG